MKNQEEIKNSDIVDENKNIEPGGKTKNGGKKPFNVFQLISIILLIAFIAGSIYFFIVIIREIGWNTLFSKNGQQNLQDYLAQFGVWKDLVFLGLIIIGVIFAFIPNNVLGVVGGFMFGLWPSFFLNTLGTIIGCVIVFWISRKLGRPVVEMMVKPETLDRVEQKLSKKGNLLFIIFMLIPFIPNDVVCYAAGLTKMRFSEYTFLVVLTRPWGIFISSFMGSGSFAWWFWVIFFAVFTLILFVFIKYGKRIAIALRKRKIWSPIADTFDEMGDLAFPLKINRKPSTPVEPQNTTDETKDETKKD